MVRFTQPGEQSLLGTAVAALVAFVFVAGVGVSLVGAVLRSDWGEVFFLVAAVWPIAAIAYSINHF